MKKIIVKVLILIFLGFAVYFAYMAYKEYQPVLKSKIQKETIKKVVVLEENNDPYDRVIDFDALKNINEEIVGWIYIPDTSIDYPILIGDSDTKYLNRDMESKWSSLGSIFSLANTDKELTDARTLLFGHNMREYQMFGELRRYLNEEFRSEHTKMYVYTKKRTFEIDIFSILTCLESDEIVWKNAELGSAEYQELLLEIEARNCFSELNKNDIESLYNNQMFSLITCNGDVGTPSRLVVNGIVSKEKYILN